eukprot:COSAG01_NODE_4012_length_5435_cov_2.306409_1_plen_29_part_10
MMESAVMTGLLGECVRVSAIVVSCSIQLI